MALNAPLFLILLYLLPLLALACYCYSRYLRHWTQYDVFSPREQFMVLLACVLLGAGLALLGAAYLHDVWYC